MSDQPQSLFPFRFLWSNLGSHKTLALYGDQGRNPLIAVGHGPQGWLIQTRKGQWMSPRLRKWSAK